MNRIIRLLTRLFSALCLASFVCGPFGAFADGLPGEYIATQRWCDLDARYSPLVNPAFMTERNYVSLRGCEALILDNTFNLTEAGVTIPVGFYQSWGFTYEGEGTALPFEGLQWRNNSPDTVAASADRDNLFMLSYANNVWGQLSIGANLSLSYQTLFGAPRLGVAVDVGLSYRLAFDPALGEHLIGLSFANILQPLTDALPTSDQFTSQGYPNDIKASWYFYLWDRQVDAGVDFDCKNVYGSMVRLKGEEQTGAMEYGASFRLGCWLLRMINAYAQIGTDYWAGSFGINFPQMNGGRDFALVYQYMNITQPENVPTQSFYFRMDCGAHREEAFAKLMALRWNMAPNELYNRALRLYAEGDYWGAYFVFSRLHAQYPNFFKIDDVVYYQGSCLEKMDMRESAAELYKETVRQYPTSEKASYADLGLMRIYYRDADHAACEGQFKRINLESVPDSLRYHALYLMAQIRMKEKDYPGAEFLFSKIPQHHPEYVFAQHSLAVALLSDNRRAEAIEHLANCINVKGLTESQKECINRSYLFLGYLFYEDLSLPKAITAFRTIAPTSFYYEDALLGMCWTALKARQWDACIEYGEALQKASSKPPLRCDAMLICGYALLMQKKYGEATTVLKDADAQLGSLSAPRTDSLAAAQKSSAKLRADYDVLSRSVDNFAASVQSSDEIDKIDSLHKVQLDDFQKLEKFSSYVDDFSRRSLFARNIEAIKSDIAFTLAVAQKFNRESGALEVQEKMQGKQNKIDEKIEEMKKELEKLNNGNK